MQHARPDKLAVGSIIFAHASVDMQTISLATLLPMILTTFNLDYATAAAIITANNVVIAVAQPLFGIFGDKRPIRWLALLGCALCGLMMVSVTWLPSYWMIVVAAMLSGVGSAIFHPEGLANTRQVGGGNNEAATSWFFLGGNIGFGLGPLLVTWLVGAFGPHGAVGMIVPTLIGCLLLYRQTPKFSRAIDPLASQAGQARMAPSVMAFVMLVLSLIVLRSVTTEGMKTFIPLYFSQETGRSAKEFAPLLTTISLSGILGTLLSGVLGARLGRREIIVGSMMVAAAALFGFLNVSSLPAQIATLAVFGIAMTIPWTINVTMVQDAMPNNLGLASGLTLGTAYGAGGLGVGALGWLADRTSLAFTLQFISFIPLAVLALSFLIPNKRAVTRGLRLADGGRR